MKIRRADEQDIEQVKILLDRNFDEVMLNYHSKSIIDKLKSHNTHESLITQLKWKKVYVVEDENGEIIGTGAFVNFGFEKEPKYSISNLYVMPEKHSQGIGNMIFNELYKNAKASHADSFHVPASLNAIGFYEKMGFTINDEQPEKEDEITWMTMSL